MEDKEFDELKTIENTDEIVNNEDEMTEVLSDETDDAERIKNAEILAIAFAEDEYDEKLRKKEEKRERRRQNDSTHMGIRAVAIASLFIAVFGLGILALSMYFMVLKPNYDKSGINKELVYETDEHNNVDLSVQFAPLITPTEEEDGGEADE